MDNDLNTIDWQTHCLGRYLVDLPSTAEVSATYEYGSGDLKTVSPITDRGFQQSIDERVAELKRTDNINGGTQLVDVTRYNDHNVVVHSWYSPNSKALQKSEFFALRGNDHKKTLYVLTRGTSPDKLQEDIELSQKVANTFQHRSSLEIPEGPGFCINHGFIASDMPNYELVRSTITFAGKPGFYLTLMTFPTSDPAEPLFARESGLPGFIMEALNQADTLRHDDRTVGHMTGQTKVQTITRDGIDYYYGTWQTEGKANSMRFQNITITMQTESPQTTHSPFPDQETALAFWDAVLNNFRMRPGAVGNAP